MAEITFQQDGWFGQAAVWQSECYPWPPLTQVSEQQVFHRPWKGLLKLDKSTTNQCSTDREKSLDVDKVKDLDRECFSLHLFITNKVEGNPSLGGVTNCARTNFEFEK